MNNPAQEGIDAARRDARPRIRRALFEFSRGNGPDVVVYVPTTIPVRDIDQDEWEKQLQKLASPNTTVRFLGFADSIVEISPVRKFDEESLRRIVNASEIE